ncbi:MAG: MBOAT family protein [Pseudomonadales bacterium]|nr:MBOAT family protein [Pseudomonadales bacterium]MBO7004641.1 MBOAT family protein [Pseudomonadales bacterium]
MIFSSATFLFAFLPVVLVGVLVSPKIVRNLFILFMSLFFYAWGELYFVALMLGSIFMNFLIGGAIGRPGTGTQSARFWLIIGIVANLLLLGYFKYANFLVENWNLLTTQLGLSSFDHKKVHLPLGISFFTFQAMSYLIDVYRGDAEHDKNPINIALYIALFPQLIAGPIIRYHDVYQQLRNRSLSVDLAYSGLTRFICGLAKKLLIANPLGEVADQIFAINGNDLSTPVAWLGILCYTLQIYFDFSGYSDMAIGLGRMLGFRFLENFNYPYIASSVQAFWRRWHISLSNWFRDYLYIPLGGNRAGLFRTYCNLVIVFFLCGLWHGASWNFVIWGLLHGAFLVIERLGFGGLLDRLPKVAGHVYTLLAVMIAWVFFRAETLAEALSYLRAMLIPGSGNSDLYYVAQYLNPHTSLVLIVGLVLATPIARVAVKAVGERSEFGLELVRASTLAVLFLLSVMTLAADAYNPFIYFRF